MFPLISQTNADFFNFLSAKISVIPGKFFKHKKTLMTLLTGIKKNWTITKLK
jgi:hypothetical protein